MKFKKELLALVCGMVFAYLWQLFFLLVTYLSNIHGNFIQAYMFIPSITIQAAIAPLVCWVLMGLFKVTWLSKWLKITAVALAFLIPFVLIAMIVLMFINPMYWHTSKFWITNTILSIILMHTVFRPLLKVDTSNCK